jgi:hypothetical protein
MALFAAVLFAIISNSGRTFPPDSVFFQGSTVILVSSRLGFFRWPCFGGKIPAHRFWTPAEV